MTLALFHWIVKTVDSAQPRNRSIVTRPFSSWEGGVWARDYAPSRVGAQSDRAKVSTTS